MQALLQVTEKCKRHLGHQVYSLLLVVFNPCNFFFFITINSDLFSCTIADFFLGVIMVINVMYFFVWPTFFFSPWFHK